MADQDYESTPLINQVAVGVDESTQQLEPGLEWDSINGVFPAFHEIHQIRLPGQPDNQNKSQGVLQRLAAKKLIDANPNQKVYAICQAFNGFGQFGYFVQTDQKLYFHTCEAPKDLHINFATLQTLGTDESNFSLDIFGHQPSSANPIADSGVSCLFEFPLGDKPAPSNAAHPGVDYLIISVTPQTPTTDTRLRLRLTALDSGTIYDLKDVGFYKTQNACRQDSVPLVSGSDGEHGLPPTNSKIAFLGWGGAVFKNTWNPGPQPVSAVWTAVSDGWQSVNPPSFSYPYRNYIQSNRGGGPGYSPYGGYTWVQSGVSPGQRLYYQSRLDSRGVDTGYNYFTVTSTINPTTGGNMLSPSSGPLVSFPNGGFPAATNSGRYGLSGTVFYQDVKYVEDAAASWQEPRNSSYAVTFVWSNQAVRQGDGVITVAGNLNKYGYQQDSKTYWQLKKTATWIYNDQATMQNSAHASADRLKYAKINNPYSWYQLTTIGVPVTVSWNYNTQADRDNAYGFIAADIGKNAHQLDTDTYWTLADYNRHGVNTDFSETFFINLNRLFTDYQNITPPSLSFMLSAYWDKIHNGAGNLDISVKSYKSGLIIRNDTIVWAMDANAVLVQQQNITKVCPQVSVDGDVVGTNLIQISVQMSNGIINLTTPAVNPDAANPCPF